MEKNTYNFQLSGSVLPMLIAFSIPVLTYGMTLSFGFTNFDDNLLITNQITFLSELKNIPRAFLTDAFLKGDGHFYRPLQIITYILDIQISGGNNAWMFHATNILLSGLAAVMLYLLLKRFFIPAILALLGTLIYFVHPLFVSSIAWIPARGDLLLALFSLLSFLFLIEFIQKHTYKYLVLHWIAFTLALFSKETAVVLPLLYFIYYALYLKRPYEKKYVYTGLLYIVSGIGWLWLRTKAIGDFSVSDNIGFTAIITNLRTIPESMARFVVPADLDPIPGFSVLRTITGVCILAVLIVLIFKSKERSRREKLFGLIWYLMFLLPTMVFKKEEIDYLDHRFFIPLIGILLFVITLISEIRSVNADLIKKWSMIATILILAASTISSMRSYSDPLTFYNSAISKNPKCVIAYNNRGATYHSQGALERAIADYTKAIALKPDYGNPHNSRGNAYLIQGLYNEAISDYTRAIELKAGDANTYNNRGAAYCGKELFDEACADFRMAEVLGSRSAKSNINKFCRK